jgi:hypothetical protein
MEVFIVLFLAFQNLRVPARDVRLAGALRGNGLYRPREKRNRGLPASLVGGRWLGRSI